MSERKLRKEGFAIISKLFDELSTHGYRDVVYRGHGDKNWDVEPSVFRAKARGIKSEEDLFRWQRLAQRFVQTRPQVNLEWLVLAQHYGVPTSLLDWTVSPLIALFFAAEDVRHRNGMVLMVSKVAFEQWDNLIYIDIFGSQREKPGMFDASVMNARALSQDSVMSLHTPDYRNEIPRKYIKEIFEVRSSEKPAVLSAMQALGLTRDRVFSDITMAKDRFIESL